MISDLGSDALLIEVKDDADLSSADRALVRRWMHEEWPPETDPYEWAPLHWFVLARRDGELVGMVTALERTVTVAGHPIRIAGIGNVITATPWRKRGIATALMQRAQAFSFDELGASFGMLLCESHLISFYERVGWQLVEGPLVFDQPAGKVTWKDRAMVLPRSGEAWPGGVIDLCGLPF
jgi:GNAT superfamily N-acetyltransferase